MSLAGLLLLTHSSRRTNLSRCSVQFLTRRFGDPHRLEDLPPFASLPPVETLYSGALSLHRVRIDARGDLHLASIGALRHRDKIQHAVVRRTEDRRDELVVGFEHRVERWRLPTSVDHLETLRPEEVDVVARHEHPHLADLHTVDLLDDRLALLSCSAADALLVLDLATGDVTRTLPMPTDLYGRGYPLDPEHDLKRHAVVDDRQTTHVNAAVWDAGGRGAWVSTLIQGAIGHFDLERGGYRELVRGLVGCHGIRRSHGDDTLYLSDSTTGCLVHLDRDRGTILRRYAVASRWLHDAVQLDTARFAFAVADRNALEIHDVERGALLAEKRFRTWPVEGLFAWARHSPGWLGNSTQALSFHQF